MEIKNPRNQLLNGYNSICLLSLKHIKKTRRESKESDEVQDENIETYTWGGVTRVRTCSLLENGYTGLFGINLFFSMKC
jgi:hypothetical protein